MSKDKAVEYLISKGYDAYLEDGVVMVRINDMRRIKKVHNELKTIGYDSSFGFKYSGKPDEM